MPVRIDGLRELEAALRELPDRVAKRVAGNALRAGARVVAAEAKARVPVDTGELRRSITVRNARRRKRDQITALIGFLRFGAELTKEGIRISPSRYAHLVEFGTRRSRAQPFMRPALDSRGREALERVKEALRKGIEKEAAKLRRR